MFNKQIAVNIKELDKQIGELNKDLSLLKKEDEDYDSKHRELTEKMDTLVDLRVKLYDSKVKNSLTPILVSGGLSLVSIGLVLKYEQTEVITSKVFTSALGMFRGS